MFKKTVSILAVVFSFAAIQFDMKVLANEAKTQNDRTPATKQRGLHQTGTAKKKRSVGKHAPVSIALGKKLYKQYQCFDCHRIAGKGCANGMQLDSIGSKRTKEFIREHIYDPDKHFDKHPGAFEIDLNLMPPQNLEPYEIDSLVEYMHSLK
ncbi:MAG: cytochrome c [Candidatus Melainabacteria bacterium]|nr:cytochrome c [Candidatus Melainabacteria bacterium]